MTPRVVGRRRVTRATCDNRPAAAGVTDVDRHRPASRRQCGVRRRHRHLGVAHRLGRDDSAPPSSSRADEPPYLPWIPELPGRNDFRGPSFHAAQWDPAFDPAGKHVAVIGTDSAAGYYLPELTERRPRSPCSPTHPAGSCSVCRSGPTRATRWLRRTRAASGAGPRGRRGDRDADPVGHPHPRRQGAPRRRDHLRHRVRGSRLEACRRRRADHPAGLADGMEPFVGVAVHGFPNYFFITGRPGPTSTAQNPLRRRVHRADERTGSTRIEVRRSSQQVFNERAHLNPAEPIPAASAFDLSGIPAHGDQADLRRRGDADNRGRHPSGAGSAHRPPRSDRRPLPLAGHGLQSASDPLSTWPDGALKHSGAATLTVDERSAPARIVEQTPWGTHSVAGVGARRTR